MSETKSITGWKVFDKNHQCRGYQFEVGKSYEATGAIVMCGNGFHFHTHGGDLFNYYKNEVHFTTGRNKCGSKQGDSVTQITL